MKTSMKTLILSSIVSVSSFSFAMADEPGENYDHHGMIYGEHSPMSDYTPNNAMGLPCYGMGSGYGMMPGYGMRHGYGMGHGYGMMPGYSMSMMLDLNESQIKQFEQIRTETIKKQRKLMRKMWQQQEALSGLLAAEKRDPKAIGEAYGRIWDLKQQALQNRIAMENQIENVLTDKQKAQMRRGVPRGMMGGGMMMRDWP